MAITTTAQFYSALTQPVRIKKNALTGLNSNPMSLWSAGGDPPAGTLAVGNTTTGVLFDSNTTGAPAITPFVAGNTGYLKCAQMRGATNASLYLYDRIWGVGAISLTSLATTTFSSQPSYLSRLPAGSNYEVEVFVEIVTATSTTATTVDVSYTNESNVSGRTMQTFNASNWIAYRLAPLALQSGDKGVKSIDSVTVGGTVATSGTINIIVARRLATFDSQITSLSDNQNWDLLGMPQVFGTSCLWLVPFCETNSAGPYLVTLDVING